MTDTAKPARQFPTLLILALAATLAPVSVDMLTPSLAVMSTDMSATPRSVELILYSFLIGYGVSPSIWGVLSDRRGRRPVMFAGMSLYCVSSLVCVMIDDVGILVAMRFIQGLGAGAGATMARAVVRDIYGAAGTTRSMARMMSLMALVPMFMPLLGGFLVQVINWQACFVGMSLIGAVSVVCFFFMVPESRPAFDLDRRGKAATATAAPILRNSTFARHALCNMFSVATLVIFGANFAFITSSEFGLDSNSNGMVLALFNLSIALGTQLVWWLVPRCGTHVSILVGAGVCATGWGGMALAAWTGHAAAGVLAPFLALAGAGSGVIMALCAGAALAPFSHNAGKASSAYLLLQSVGSSAISMAVGMCLPKELLPMALAMVACAGLALLMQRALE